MCGAGDVLVTHSDVSRTARGRWNAPPRREDPADSNRPPPADHEHLKSILTAGSIIREEKIPGLFKGVMSPMVST